MSSKKKAKKTSKVKSTGKRSPSVENVPEIRIHSQNESSVQINNIKNQKTNEYESLHDSINNIKQLVLKRFENDAYIKNDLVYSKNKILTLEKLNIILSKPELVLSIGKELQKENISIYVPLNISNKNVNTNFGIKSKIRDVTLTFKEN